MPITHRVLGSLLGAAIGDTLGMPVEMLSHQNVRTYYRGLRDFVGDEKRGDLGKGQVTGRSQLMLLLGHSLISGTPVTDMQDLRRVNPQGGLPDGVAISACTAFGVLAASNQLSDEQLADRVIGILTNWVDKPETLVAGFGQARLIRDTIYNAEPPNGKQFIEELLPAVRLMEKTLGADDSVFTRLSGLPQVLDGFPLDLQDYCGGTGSNPDQAWPFAVGMFARNPGLVEANMLSAVNVGGDAPTVGACLGGLLGALHGPDRFPSGWIEQLEIRRDIEDLVARLG